MINEGQSSDFHQSNYICDMQEFIVKAQVEYKISSDPKYLHSQYQNIMSKNLEIYVSAFIEAFEVDEGEVVTLKYESIPAWDSVGHMVLMAALEEGFDIMLDMEDIIDFSDFEKGKELLKKYDVAI